MIPALKVLKCPCVSSAHMVHLSQRDVHELRSPVRQSPEGHWPKGFLDVQRGGPIKEGSITGRLF